MKTTKKRPAALFFILLLAFISNCNSTKDVSSDNFKSCEELSAEKIPDQLIIKFDSCANQDSIDIYIKNEIPKFGEIKTRCMCNEELILIELHETVLDLEVAHAKANDRLRPEGLGSAHFNFEIKLDSVPENIDTSRHFQQKEAPVFEKEVIVAVIDVGINWMNTGLEQYRWDISNYTSSDTCKDPFLSNMISDSDPINQHGTIVSKFITQGLDASQIKLMDLRAFNKDGKGSLFDALCAFNFALENGANIINMSWGYYKYEFNPHLINLFQTADAQDVLIVASAGNDTINTDICHHYPSGFDAQTFNYIFDNVVSVAYLNQSKDKLAERSNFGLSSVSIAAPGYFSPNFQGSSYAAPSVTRMAAIIKGLHPEYKHKKIIDCIYDQASATTTPLPVSTKDKLNEQMNTNCLSNP